MLQADTNPKRLLITGGCGFIGTNLAAYFADKGWQVSVLDSLSRKGSGLNLQWLQETYPRVRFVKADIRHDDQILREEAGRHDVVFHLAAQVAVTTSVERPREDFDINALGTFNVLEAIRAERVKPIVVFASTNKVYGGMEDVEIELKDERYAYRDFPQGIPEDRVLDFHSPYGCSKGAADQYVRDYARIYDIPTVVLRQSCIYGPRQFGVEDQGWIAWFTIAALLEKPITVYGDGKQVRDVLHIDDLAQVYERVIEKIDTVRGQVFNIGGGSGYTLSVKEVFPLLEELLQRKIPLQHGDWRPGDQPVYISDIAKAKDRLGWQPGISPEEGIASLAKWCQDNVELLRNLKLHSTSEKQEKKVKVT